MNDRDNTKYPVIRLKQDPEFVEFQDLITALTGNTGDYTRAELRKLLSETRLKGVN